MPSILQSRWCAESNCIGHSIGKFWHIPRADIESINIINIPLSKFISLLVSWSERDSDVVKPTLTEPQVCAKLYCSGRVEVEELTYGLVNYSTAAFPYIYHCIRIWKKYNFDYIDNTYKSKLDTLTKIHNKENFLRLLKILQECVSEHDIF